MSDDASILMAIASTVMAGLGFILARSVKNWVMFLLFTPLRLLLVASAIRDGSLLGWVGAIGFIGLLTYEVDYVHRIAPWIVGVVFVIAIIWG